MPAYAHGCVYAREAAERSAHKDFFRTPLGYGKNGGIICIIDIDAIVDTDADADTGEGGTDEIRIL